MKFTGSVLGRILSALLCIILGIIIGLGGLAGGIYYVLTKSTVKTVTDYAADYVGDDMPELSFSDEVAEMSVLEWAQKLKSLTDSSATTTIGDIEQLIGYPAISKKLTDAIGVDASVIQASTIDDLGKSVMDALTVETACDKFDIELPDMPLFSDATFLSSPLSEAFKNITDYPLSDFVNLDDESNKVLVAIKDLTIDELGGEKLTEKINGMKLSDVIAIGGESNSVLVALKDTTIGDLGGANADAIINSLFMGEIMNIDDNSTAVLKALKYSSIETSETYAPKEAYDTSTAAFEADEAYSADKELEGYTYLYSADGGTVYACVKDADGNPVVETADGEERYKVYETKLSDGKYRPVIGINDTVDTLKLKQVIDIDESDTLMWSLRDSTFKSITGDIKTLFLGQVMTIDATSSKTVQALKYASLESQTAYVPVADVVSNPGAADEADGYPYIYTADGGNYTAYVVKIGDNGAYAQELREGVDCYVAYKTASYDGKTRPLIGVNDTIETIFIDQLLTVDENSSQTIKTIRYCTTESHTAALDKSDFDASTAAYKASADYNASYEVAGYTYLYSDKGVAFVCRTDDSGLPVTEGTGDGICYVAYRTSLYSGKYYPQTGIDDKIKTVTVGEVITIDDSSSKLMKSLQYTKIDDMDTAVNSLFLDEIMTVTEGVSSQTLVTLRYSVLTAQTKTINKSAYDASTAAFESTAEYAAAQLLEVSGCEYLYSSDGSEVYVLKSDDGTDYTVYETKLYADKNRPLSSIDDRLQTVTLGEVIAIDDTSAKLMQSLKDTKINEMDGAVKTLFMDEILDIDSTSAQILQSLEHSSLETSVSYIPVASSTDYAGEGKLDGYVYKTYNGGIYICYMNAGAPVEELYETAESYKVYDTKLYEGKYYPLVGIDDTLKDLAVKDIFSADLLETGVLSLISPETKLDDISTEVASAVRSSTMSVLIGVGVIDATTFDTDSLPAAQRAFVFNSTLTQVMSGMITFIGHPTTGSGLSTQINYAVIQPVTVDMSGTYSSITEFAAAYSQYNTINLTGDVTVAVDEAADAAYLEGNYVVPIFNLTGSSYTLTFTGATVKLGVYDGAALSNKQYAHSYDASSGSNLEYYAGTITHD